ncbi:hypothetical protein GJV26_01235 [Massilia dura]|uniref:Penicillin-binding protein transpeptidase domain-containing protein n=1 Tax=Pseudoduganella dura TaxID=321982 RepID=A0A6I3XD46_9BURK|nr:penicillin-binding transpeptidase domain-containing protein [Pseudoduganella dura]MUI11122.1 hypothetical protein [Pseudoduganella dura]GGY10242.1 hypothetical protein GCM10007386_45780 [Pseudoduganella dura]
MAQLLADHVEHRRRAWRRERNLRGPRAVPWGLLAASAFVLLGGSLLGANALRIGTTAAATEAGGDAPRAAAVFQPVLPGARFDVPGTPGTAMLPQPGGALVVASGLRAEDPVRIDLCRDLAGAGAQSMSLRLGYRFADVERWHGAGARAAARNVLLVAQGSKSTASMPRLTLTGHAGLPLQLAWTGAPARWLGDGGDGIVRAATGKATLNSEGWLAWEGGALHMVRRPSAACPRAGELVARIHGPDPARSGRAQVTAFAAHGASATAWLAPGSYAVPVQAAPELEDEALFAALQARGLARLADDGAIELAPQDLPAWRAAPVEQRATDLDAWRHVRIDAAAVRLLRRLYRQADGSYVRQQVALYNSERALLAWRVRTGETSRWRADGPVTDALAPLAARLFAALPQGWQPWTRLASPPAGSGSSRLTLDLPQPSAQAGAGDSPTLLLAGRLLQVEGALVQARPACDGRACAAPDDVQLLRLQPRAGARRIVLTVAPLDARQAAQPGEYRYRHLRVVANRIVWQPLAYSASGPAEAARRGGPDGPMRVADRNGTPLWTGDGATAAATRAGLAPLLGLGPGHESGIAGMLARAGSGGARLSLDLPLQALAQRVLDCVALRRGRWQDGRCDGGTAPPAQRRVGIVVLDAENGDILAAAGAGQPRVDAGNWAEARALDRASPAGSALRLPALQHDGGAHHSPGSTFKIVSALGLELAAKNDRRLDRLLAGEPLPAINALARERGFDFATAAPTYPAAARGAYVTNYREQGIDRRAREGRLGLAQALAYSLNTWFAWTGELSDRTLFGDADGGAPDLQPLEAGALDDARPILAAARRLGFERRLRLDGGLLAPDFRWGAYDALQATPAHVDPVHTRHELRQMSIGLRMQATPLQMALAAAAIGQGATAAPRLLLELDERTAAQPAPARLDIRLDRIRAGMKGVIDAGTAAGAFHGLPRQVRAGLYGKTGTAPTGTAGDSATVWFTGWLEPGSLPGQRHRLAFAVHASHSEGTGGDHAAPAVAALLGGMAGR